MGYRSVVALAVSKKMMPHFLGHLSQCDDAAYKLVFMEADKKIEDYDGDGTTMFLWEDIKWYDSYECVQAIVDFIDWCENETIEVDGNEVDAYDFYRFIRIGEEMDDNEVEGWGFDIHIERSATY